MSTAKGKVAVTGATGFLGYRAVPALADAGYEVLAVTRPDSEPRLPTGISKVAHWTGDIDELTRSIQDFSPAACLHLATHFVGTHQASDIDTLVDSNVRFSTQIAEACASASRVAFVNVETIWQHAGSTDYSPTSLYAATKQAFVDILHYYSEVVGMRVFNLTMTDTYGPNDKRPKLWNAMIRAAQTGETLSMNEGSALIGPLYITDAVDALVKAVQQAIKTDEAWTQHEVSTTTVTLKQLVKMFEKASGTKLDVKWGAFDYRPREMFEAWHHGSLLPTWSPKVPLQEGLATIWNAAN